MIPYIYIIQYLTEALSMTLCEMVICYPHRLLTPDGMVIVIPSNDSSIVIWQLNLDIVLGLYAKSIISSSASHGGFNLLNDSRSRYTWHVLHDMFPMIYLWIHRIWIMNVLYINTIPQEKSVFILTSTGKFQIFPE